MLLTEFMFEPVKRTCRTRPSNDQVWFMVDDLHNFMINPLNTKRRLLYLKTQFVPRSKHFSSRL